MKRKIQTIQSAIFMMAMSINHRLIAVLDYPADIEDFIADAAEIHNSMVAAPYFASSAAKLATLATNTSTLTISHTGLHSVPPTHTRAERDADRVTVQNDLRDLRMDVQTAANAAGPALAETVILSAKMKVKQQGTIDKQNFTVKDGPVSGTVKLVAKAAENTHSAHDWAMSIDGTNWTPITPTLAATTVVSGFTPGQILDFRTRTILKDGPGDWIEYHSWVVR